MLLASGWTVSPESAAWAQRDAEEDGAPATPEVKSLPDKRKLTVRLDRMAADSENLTVDLIIEHLLDPATTDVLERGIPVTLVCEVEIWRERSAWFDRLEAFRAVSTKLQWDAWDEVYVLRSGDREETYAQLADAARALERRRLPIARLDLLDDDESYYLIINAALKPLTVEDVDELEGWLSGEIQSGRRHGFGLLGLPKAFYGLVKNVTGFGDRNDTLRTDSFRRSELLATRPASP